MTGEKARLVPEVELGAFRIAQEAVRNTLGHAAARRLRVTVSFQPGGLGLTVSDDGCGFDLADVDEMTRDAHLGLLGMRERAHLLGGQLNVRSAPGKGTVVHASFPLVSPILGKST